MLSYGAAFVSLRLPFVNFTVTSIYFTARLEARIWLRARRLVNLNNLPWLAYIAVESALVGILIYRRVWKSLPVFCLYCAWDILSNVALLFLGTYSYSTYFRAYFAQTIGDTAFQVCVLVELTWSLLRPLRSSISRSALLFISLAILLIAALIWPFAAFSSLAHVANKQWLILAQLQHTLALLRILFFLVLAAGSQLLSISWRDRELQVATGLGFISIVSLGVTIAQARQSTPEQYAHLEQITVLAFICSLIYWAISFMQKEAERQEFTPQMQKVLLAVAGAARTTRVSIAESKTPSSPKL